VDSGAEPAAATEPGAGASTPGKSPRLLKGGAHEADSTAKVRASRADGVVEGMSPSPRDLWHSSRWFGFGLQGPAPSPVELRHLWFRYDPALPWTLKGISLQVPAGSKVAGGRNVKVFIGAVLQM
jgi:hypothetical protein